MPTLLLSASGMDDADDARAVKEKLGSHDGVYCVSADAGSGRVEVDFEDDEVAAHELLDEMEALGYPATVTG